MIAQCVRWFAMESEKREAILKIIGDCQRNHFEDLAVLTGFSADLLRCLWGHREATMHHYEVSKKSYEEGLVIGMYESRCSIEKITDHLNLHRQVIEGIIEREGRLSAVSF